MSVTSSRMNKAGMRRVDPGSPPDLDSGCWKKRAGSPLYHLHPRPFRSNRRHQDLERKPGAKTHAHPRPFPTSSTSVTVPTSGIDQIRIIHTRANGGFDLYLAGNDLISGTHCSWARSEDRIRADARPVYGVFP